MHRCGMVSMTTKRHERLGSGNQQSSAVITCTKPPSPRSHRWACPALHRASRNGRSSNRSAGNGHPMPRRKWQTERARQPPCQHGAPRKAHAQGEAIVKRAPLNESQRPRVRHSDGIGEALDGGTPVFSPRENGAGAAACKRRLLALASPVGHLRPVYEVARVEWGVA